MFHEMTRSHLGRHVLLLECRVIFSRSAPEAMANFFFAVDHSRGTATGRRTYEVAKIRKIFIINLGNIEINYIIDLDIHLYR